MVRNEVIPAVGVQDGSIEWLTLPTIGNDNIWLPQGFDHLDAGANASGPSDSFVTH